MGCEQPREPLAVTCRGEGAKCLLGLVVRLEPARRARPHPSHLGGGRTLLGESELAHRRAERVPAGRVALQLDEQTASRQRVQRLRGAGDPERLAEGCGEPVERRDRPHQGLDLGGLVREDLGGEVREEGPARTRMRSSVACRSPGGTPRSASTASRTAAGQPPVARWSRTAVSASAAPASEARSVAVSSASNESSAPPSSSTCPWPRRRSMGKGSSAREARTTWSRGGAWRQRDSITCTAPTEPATAWTSSTTSTRSRRRARLQGLAQGCRKSPRPRGLVLLRARARPSPSPALLRRRAVPGRAVGPHRRGLAQSLRAMRRPRRPCTRRSSPHSPRRRGASTSRTPPRRRPWSDAGSSASARVSRSRSRRRSGVGAIGGRSRICDVADVRERATEAVALRLPTVSFHLRPSHDSPPTARCPPGSGEWSATGGGS